MHLAAAQVHTDFLAHRQIKQILHEDTQELVSTAQLEHLGKRLQRARTASQEAEQWLRCVFLSNQLGTEYQAKITQINSGGFVARLLDNGIDGLVDLRESKEKFSFDRWTASLKSADHHFQLDTEVRVRLESVNLQLREIRLSPVIESPTPAPIDAPTAEDNSK